MKNCPYCAEEIQDAAIVCKHCGRTLDLEAVARVASAEVAGGRPSSPQLNKPLVSVVETAYAELISALRRSEVVMTDRYPLSPNRRSYLIARIVELAEAKAKSAPKVLLLNYSMWWQFEADPKRKKKQPSFNWREQAERLLGVAPSNPEFPTEDEWISAVAAILVRAAIGGYAPAVGMIDWMSQWQRLQKSRRADRMLRGLTILGAATNLVSAFAPKKPPKEGSFDWNIWRRAAAQFEATALFSLDLAS